MEQSELSLETLAQYARQGNKEAFGEIYQRCKKEIYFACLRMVRNEAAAEDITQDVFLKAWRFIANFRGESDVKTWLHSIARNEFLMLIRGDEEKKYPHNYIDEQEENGPTTELPAEDASARSMVARMTIPILVDYLPPLFRTVLVLRDIEELSTEETAEMLNLSVPAVKARLFRARLQLKKIARQKTTPQEFAQAL